MNTDWQDHNPVVIGSSKHESRKQSDNWELLDFYTHPPADTKACGWYCAHCERGVDSSEVTFHEQHQECGRIITSDYPPKKDTVRVPVEAISVLQENLRDKDAGVIRLGIRDNDATRKAIETIFKAAQGEG